MTTRLSGALCRAFSIAALLAGAATVAQASDNKIALIPGGPHPYFAPWEQAAADAQKDFGIAAVDFKVPSEWKLNLQTELVESLVTQGYTAFGIFPGDAVGINSTVEELEGAGIPAAALAGCAQDPTKMQFCLGTDVYNSAYLGTKALIEAMGGKGKIVHLAGLLVDPNTKLRMDAVEKAVGETNGAVSIVQHITDTDAQEAADQKINALLGAQKDQIDGLISTAYIPSVVAAKSLRNLGDKRIKLVGIDDDPIVLDAIKDGFAAGTMAQNPYGQGYVGAYVLDLLAGGGCTVKADAPWIQTPQTAHFIDSGTLLISAANIASYKDDLKKITSDIQSSFKDKYLDCK
ncbi:substrate-binding domain-containing protein [Prosthecomicrobium pneumaticum]|uniref:Ribose transport system substrate-binding protein n=1 Tax=Prosthecomicrobium pneumaticum TaxID=81895 RepID=A0A7W9CTB6_9HYPH|nr:sugar ABC transporter substrate-binding protein [Prosthecomicrobium pneumaticum]MBB5751173.1 ribose transport system substrate-binding protein [Prosthecomicrobium pneumaticum]